MAGRRYTRDNRGRFATVGATARGGRLATASGNKRATQTAKIGGGSPKGTVGKPKGLKPGSIKPKASAKSVGRSGKGRAPQSKLPSSGSDAYKYNKSGFLAEPGERAKMRARDRAREKNAALEEKQRAGKLKAQRRAARSVEQGRFPVQAFSSTANAAKAAHDRRVKRASENFGAGGVDLMRRESSLTQKATRIEAKAAERKAAGKSVTSSMQSQHAELRRQILKIQKSQATRKKALGILGQTKNRLESNIQSRYSRNFF
jgi:hypothetical protein